MIFADSAKIEKRKEETDRRNKCQNRDIIGEKKEGTLKI